ncbi:MAG: bifunctional hydroxymethylpyrimidine kinase/phosphomethylpyrimidine kinase [Synechococcaceae cyanobacterium]|nr:bifunctional hydroxymethylpyrimidine kinase/phosphomethylpyrimidine kinase [Synechococcaceae cyanobacterium]
MADHAPTASGPQDWDRRYRDGSDAWELGQAAPPLQRFLRSHPLAPRPPARVLVPGCGRGHEARLLAELGFHVVGLDFSGEAIAAAQRLHGPSRERLRWLQADLLDPGALAAAELLPGSVDGIVEHTCFCALEPELRRRWLESLTRLLSPQGWLLGLFACHRHGGGPPYGIAPGELAALLGQGGLVPRLWLPALQTATGRDGRPRLDEWLGFWVPSTADCATAPLAARPQTPPVVLSIGGSDSGGGAGLQADLRTFAALRVHGCTALTVVTAQNTCGVERVEPLSTAMLQAQVEAVARDLPVRAVKTGMLLDRARIEATAAAIAPLEGFRLIDPVMVSRTGAVLLEADAITSLIERLLPLASLITPNRREAELLCGRPLENRAALEEAAEQLARLTPGAVLIKGAGLDGCRGRDLLWQEGEGCWLQSPPIDTPHSHGSGCTLAAAITAWTAHGLPLPQAIAAAKEFVQAGLIGALAIGAGQGPLGHWSGQLAEPPGAGAPRPDPAA